MMGSSSMIKIFLATSAVASPKLVVLSVLIYLGSSQTLQRHRFPKWHSVESTRIKLLGKMAERMPVSLCANGGFAGTIKTKISGRPSLFRSSGLRRLDMNSSCFQLTGFRIFLPHAYRALAGAVGRVCAWRLPVCPESEPADYPHPKAAELRKHAEAFSRS